MGVISNKEGTIFIHGNFAKVKKGRPKRNPYDKEYKAIVPFDFKWRAKLGRVTCDCKEVLECYQPYYGFTFYHSDECAIAKHLKKYPQMLNFFWESDPMCIAQSE